MTYSKLLNTFSCLRSFYRYYNKIQLKIPSEVIKYKYINTVTEKYQSVTIQ